MRRTASILSRSFAAHQPARLAAAHLDNPSIQTRPLPTHTHNRAHQRKPGLTTYARNSLTATRRPPPTRFLFGSYTAPPRRHPAPTAATGDPALALQIVSTSTNEQELCLNGMSFRCGAARCRHYCRQLPNTV